MSEEIIRLIIVSLSWVIVFFYCVSRYLTFTSGLSTIKSVLLDYITIRKVKAIKEMQDDYLKSVSNKTVVEKSVTERHMNVLNRIQRENVDFLLENAIGYYPSKSNLVKEYIKFLVPKNEKFAVPPEGYEYITYVIDFVVQNKDYLDFEIVKLNEHK
jgi:hypothetical protein